MAEGGYVTIAWIIFLTSEVFAALIIFNLFKFEYVLWADEDMEKYPWKRHMRIMGITMTVLNGHGMIIFRLIPTVTTRITKCIHAFIHTFIMFACGLAYYEINVFMTDQNLPKFSFDHLHTIFALITIVTYLFQWVTGMYVYCRSSSDQKARKQFSAIHNFIGIVILQISIATCAVQLQIMDYELNINVHHAQAAMTAMIIYGALINAIVLNPFLEWKLVGPL